MSEGGKRHFDGVRLVFKAVEGGLEVDMPPLRLVQVDQSRLLNMAEAINRLKDWLNEKPKAREKLCAPGPDGRVSCSQSCEGRDVAVGGSCWILKMGDTDLMPVQNFGFEHSPDGNMVGNAYHCLWRPNSPAGKGAKAVVWCKSPIE